MLVLPGVIASVVWMARRDRRAATLMLMIAAGEVTGLLTTDYPPGVLRWMSFRDHVRVGTLHGIFGVALALLVPDIPRRNRRVLLLLAAIPLVVNPLSDTRNQQRRD
jgi:ABC-type Fe3+ transport system permease subunit